MAEQKALSQEFMAILQQNAEDFRKAEVTSDWMPPVGDYTVIGGAFACGTSAGKEGKPAFNWFRLPGRIEAPSNPELHGKVFSLLFGTTQQVGLLKAQCSGIAGRIVETILEVPAVLEQADGVVFSVNVSTNKKGYAKVGITQIHGK
jgi:hypothetical protein